MSKKKQVRAHGGGSVEQRGSAQFRARIHIHGKAYRETFETREAASAWLDSLVAQHTRPGRIEHLIQVRQMTLQDALEKRLEHLCRRPKVNIDNQRNKTQFLIATFPRLVRKPIYELDELDILSFVKRRVSDGAANATVNGDLSLISNAFNLARSQFGAVGLCNPIGAGTRLHVDNARVRRLTGQEEAALMAAAQVDDAVHATSIGAVIQFAIGTAMRLGEIAGMQWADVDLQNGTVLLTKTKNGETRLVPLWPSLRAILESLGPQQSTSRVWASYDRLQNAWERVREAAAAQASERGDAALAKSLRGLRFHDLRHEGTSRLIERTGWPDSEIMAVTGHKTAAMLRRYTHLRSGQLASKMEALEGGVKLRLVSAIAEPAIVDVELPASVQLKAAWKIVSNNASLLNDLVARRPIRDVAAQFGVSDVAVHKACVRLGVAKPRRGFWNRADSRTAA